MKDYQKELATATRKAASHDRLAYRWKETATRSKGILDALDGNTDNPMWLSIASREAHNLTQKALAIILEVDDKTVWLWEHGRNGAGPANLEGLRMLLQLPVQDRELLERIDAARAAAPDNRHRIGR